jgi:hypothetical protein
MITGQSQINQSIKNKGENTRNKMEKPTSKKRKESPMRANHKGNIKFPNPLLLPPRSISNNEKSSTS